MQNKFKNKINALFLFVMFMTSNVVLSLTETNQPKYPQVKGYFGILHPIVTFQKNSASYNFSDVYTVGFPTGINVFKNDSFGYSLEVVPFIKVEDGKDKVYNVLFHPGLVFRLKHGISFIPRLAFDTSGRYGFTTIFSKIIVKSENVNYFIATPLPVRFGNEKPVSVGVGFQIGATF